MGHILRAKMNRMYIVFILINCLSAKLFSQQQTYIYLPENVKMEILLDSTVTSYFGNNLYMDIWERLWIKSNHNLACIDFSGDSLEVNYATLRCQSNINDICPLYNGDMIVADDSALLTLNDAGCKIISYLPYPNMQIAPADTNGIYVFGKSASKNKYDISLFDLSRKVTRLFSLNDEVKGIAGDGNITIVVLNNALLLFSRKVEPTVFYKTDNEIRSIAVTNFGSIFIATQKGLIYFEKMKRAYTFCNAGAKKLWYINDKLYVLFDDGKFAVIYPANKFRVPDLDFICC